MRKTTFESSKFDRPARPDGWLDLDKIAQVAVTSEDPSRPVESAFDFGESSGWQAGGKGEQTIRLIFDRPQRLKRIWLRFEETETERMQQISLRWRPEKEGPAREIVRQQWNFSPSGSTTEIEDYKVDLSNVGILELTINPDVSQGEALATLAEFRIA
jgi:hypothetical protein